MAKRSTKNLESLDQYILDDNLKRSPAEVARKRQLVFSSLGLLLLVVSMGLIIFGVVEIRKFSNNGQWPTTPGEITRVSIQTITRRRSPTQYCVFATYSYNVGGSSYEHGWSTGDCSTQRSLTESRAPSYIGGTGTIWYDPTNPGRSLNERVGMEWMLIIWGVAGISLLASVVFLWLAMQKPAVQRTLRQPARTL
ncbi:MAG: DUF3592 domain-containing protein [Anaerolineae bacterium]